jgi:hypothetical protein
MSDLKNARSAARAAATNESTATAKKGRAPSPRPEDGTDANTSETAPAAEVVEINLVVVASNPKRAGTTSHGIYEMYKASTGGQHGVLTTLSQVRKDGVRGKDISWDAERRHILMDNPTTGETHATDFAALESREDRCAFLRTLGVRDRELIKWGYMDEPKAEAPPAAEEAKQEEATA